MLAPVQLHPYVIGGRFRARRALAALARRRKLSRERDATPHCYDSSSSGSTTREMTVSQSEPYSSK